MSDEVQTSEAGRTKAEAAKADSDKPDNSMNSSGELANGSESTTTSGDTSPTRQSAAAEPAAAIKPVATKPTPAAKPTPSAAPAKPAAAKKPPAPPDPRVEAAKAEAEKIKAVLVKELGEDVVEAAGAAHVKPMVLIRKENWARAVDLLRTHPEYLLDYVECMAGTDYPAYIEVVIYVQSTKKGHFVCLKTRTDKEDLTVPSITPIYPGVNWEEREIFDLLGVRFADHPDLRRIMMPDDYKGHPLRKDFSPWD